MTAPAPERAALSLTEAGGLFGVSRRRLRAAIARGELRGARDGKRVVVLRADVERWLLRDPIAPSAEGASIAASIAGSLGGRAP